MEDINEQELRDSVMWNAIEALVIAEQKLQQQSVYVRLLEALVNPDGWRP